MAKKPGFQYDIFISYSAASVLSGWVPRFRESLDALLSQRLGRGVSIFARGAEVSMDELFSVVSDSAIFVPLLSPDYLKSDRCRQELEVFLKNHDDVSPEHRVYPIDIRPVDESLADPVLQHRFRGIFFDREKEPLSPGSSDWNSNLAHFAIGLASMISALEGGSLSEPGFDSPPYGPADAPGNINFDTSSSEGAVESVPDHPADASDSYTTSYATPTTSTAIPVAEPPPPSPEPPPPERVSARADNPASTDELGRRPFAEVLAARIDEVWLSQKPRATPSGTESGFMVHLDGPWGSGKSSVLNFLKASLQSHDRPPDRRWLVIEFNAWQQQRIRPPWWTLIREVYTQSLRQLDLRSRLRVMACWWRWRLRADLIPLAATAIVILICILISTGVIHFVPATVSPAANGKETSAAWHTTLDSIFKVISTLLAVGAGIYTLSRTMVFGSARAAQTYVDLHSDPLRPIAQLFTALVSTSHLPLLVLIDDLDRCDGKYVVELLEGIQTLFRRGSVTYVVAADRRWICSSFDKEFENYQATICDPGKPLGYLFLDKVFQVSVSIPRLSQQWQQAYWRSLLRAASSADPSVQDAVRKQAEGAAMAAVQGIHSQEGLQSKINEASGDPVREQAVRVAAARQITAAESRVQTEHRLQPWAELIEHNPRAMKRTVNAVAMRQAIHFLEGRKVSPEAIAMWTMVEMRWPILAQYLAENPSAIRSFQDGGEIADRAASEEIRKLFSDAAVKAVISAQGVTGVAALDEIQLRELVV